MTEPLIFLRNELDIVENKLRQIFYGVHYQDIPEVLYHYTSTDGLLGIINSHCLHATNVNFMNDSMEIQYGLNLVKEVVDNLSFSNIQIMGVGKILWICSQPKFSPVLLDPNDSEVFTTCFSMKPNQLSQWRGYGCQGQGYSLGFNTSSIKANMEASEAFLCKVIYNPDEQKDFISNIFKLTFEALKNTNNAFNINENTGLINECIKFITYELSIPLISYKDPGFEEENEWRLVAIRFSDDLNDYSKVKFKNSKGLLTPYLELDFSSLSDSGNRNLPITEIYCGPTLKPEITIKYVEQLLKNYGYSNSITVKSSGIPFRPRLL